MGAAFAVGIASDDFGARSPQRPHWFQKILACHDASYRPPELIKFSINADLRA